MAYGLVVDIQRPADGLPIDGRNSLGWRHTQALLVGDGVEKMSQGIAGMPIIYLAQPSDEVNYIHAVTNPHRRCFFNGCSIFLDRPTFREVAGSGPIRLFDFEPDGQPSKRTTCTNSASVRGAVVAKEVFSRDTDHCYSVVVLATWQGDELRSRYDFHQVLLTDPSDVQTVDRLQVGRIARVTGSFVTVGCRDNLTSCDFKGFPIFLANGNGIFDEISNDNSMRLVTAPTVKEMPLSEILRLKTRRALLL